MSPRRVSSLILTPTITSLYVAKIQVAILLG